MARKHSKSMKRRTHKGRRHRGGGWGFTGPSSIPGTPGIVNNAQVFTGIGDCRAVRPGYDIPYSSYAASMKGLPGMSGGKRTRKQKGKRTRKQRGGRYGFFPEGDPNSSGQLYYAGSYAPIQRIACEGGSFNPLNPTHTGSSAPPGAANPNYWMKGGALAPATYGVGNVDSMYYYAPTGGYANTASTWKDSVGAPVQIQVPYAARAMNQACLTTGGHPPLTGALQKGGRRTRKQRGGVELPKLPTFGNIQGIFGKGKNAVLGLFGKSSATVVPEEEVVTESVTETVTETPVVEAAPPSIQPVNYGLANRKAPSLPESTVTGATKTNAPVPGSAPRVGNLVNNAESPNEEGAMVMGGRRHKKSKKSRKHRKGHRKH